MRRPELILLPGKHELGQRDHHGSGRRRHPPGDTGFQFVDKHGSARILAATIEATCKRGKDRGAGKRGPACAEGGLVVVALEIRPDMVLAQKHFGMLDGESGKSAGLTERLEEIGVAASDGGDDHARDLGGTYEPSIPE